jgi:hypothetical protein
LGAAWVQPASVISPATVTAPARSKARVPDWAGAGRANAGRTGLVQGVLAATAQR